MGLSKPVVIEGVAWQHGQHRHSMPARSDNLPHTGPLCRLQQVLIACLSERNRYMKSPSRQAVSVHACSLPGILST